MSIKHIYFVRHGEAEGNVTGISQDVHTPLTKNGHRQAIRLAERCKGLDIQKIYTSNMARAIETGSYIAGALEMQPIQSELFREWSTPKSVRGKHSHSSEYATWFAELEKNHANPAWRYEDAENFSDLMERANEVTTLLESEGEENILVVTHGKFLRFFCAYALHQKKLPIEQHLLIANSVRLTNTGITVYEVNEGVWTLITWNDHAHFAE